MAQGWEELGQEKMNAAAAGEPPIGSILYSFQPAQGFTRTLLVLGTYLINGHFEQDSQTLKRPTGRGANLLGERPAYFARLQISRIEHDRAEDVGAMRELTRAITRELQQMVPYWENEPQP